MKNRLFRTKNFVFPMIVFFFLFMAHDSFLCEAGPQDQTFGGLLDEAKSLYQAGEYEKAIEVGLKALSLARTSDQYSDAYFYLSLFHFSISDLEQSGNYLQMMFEINPEKVIDETLYPLGFLDIFKSVKQKNTDRLLQEAKKRKAEEKEEEVKTPAVKTVPQQIQRPRRKKNTFLFVLGGVVLAGGAIAVLAFSKGKDDEDNGTTGSISVSSDPGGAQVYLDGTSQGQTTPATLSNVSEGVHLLKLDLDYFGMWEGNVTVYADQTTSVDKKLNPYKYEYLLKWGGGSLNLPRGIAVDQSGYVYVADTFNHRIVKYSSSGSYIKEWGGEGSANNQFNYPTRVAVDSKGYLHVADSVNNRVVKYDSDGNYQSKIGGTFGSGDYQFKFAQAVTVDNGDNIYVADNENHRIVKYNYSGTYLTKWGSYGSGDNQFQYPYDIVSDGSNSIYVVDCYNHRICKFDSSGNFIAKWGGPGSGEDQFNYPYGIGIDAHGYVYVGDGGNNRIVKYEKGGEFILSWGSPGSGDSQFQTPVQVAIDLSNNVYVADSANHRIVKYKLSASTADNSEMAFSPFFTPEPAQILAPPRNITPGWIEGMRPSGRYPFLRMPPGKKGAAGEEKVKKNSSGKSKPDKK